MTHRMLVAIAVVLLWTPAAFGAPCPRQDWSQFLTITQNGMSCTIGAHSFSDFSFDAGNSGLTADKIGATPLGLGFQFDLMDFTVTNPIQGLTASKGLTLDFKITDDSAKRPIKVETLNISGVNTNNGDATVEDSENGFSANILAGRPMAAKTFTPPKGMVRVEHRLSVGTGMNLGASATISQYTAQFTAVPEPSTTLLVALGLVGVGLWVARKRGAPRRS